MLNNERWTPLAGHSGDRWCKGETKSDGWLFMGLANLKPKHRSSLPTQSFSKRVHGVRLLMIGNSNHRLNNHRYPNFQKGAKTTSFLKVFGVLYTTIIALRLFLGTKFQKMPLGGVYETNFPNLDNLFWFQFSLDKIWCLWKETFLILSIFKLLWFQTFFQSCQKPFSVVQISSPYFLLGHRCVALLVIWSC